jgi:alpha-tubulin suppressor-like RCC1 family protein
VVDLADRLPSIQKEKAFEKTILVYVVPVTFKLGASADIGLEGTITGRLDVGKTPTTDEATLTLAGGPYVTAEGFGEGAVGAAFLSAGARVTLTLVDAHLTAAASGTLTLTKRVENGNVQPLQIAGGLSERLSYSTSFLDGRVGLTVTYPTVKWCTVKVFGRRIKYPCGVRNETKEAVLCSWPGYSYGGDILNASQDLFTIDLCTPTGSCDGKCGSIFDGCGGTLDCGGCSAPATCGGGGIPNVCGTPALTTAIAAGRLFSCAVQGGAAYCWGGNGCGQLGDGTTQDRTVPVRVQGLDSGVTAIAVSPNGCHACAVVNGAAKCWGGNGVAQLGDGTNQGSSVPVQPVGLESGVTAIGVGGIHTCAVVNGSAKCWGDSTSGALGLGDTASWIPAQVVGLTTGVQAITAGIHHTCAVVNGGVWCWGWSNHGELGNGFQDLHNTPVQVTGLESGVTAISAGAMHSCAVVNGSAWCWGFNLHGELGSTAGGLIPAQVTGLTAGVQAVGAGYYHTCAVVSGSAWCWGDGSLGKLGNNSTVTSWSPVQVSSISGVQAASAGETHTCAVAQGIAYCWGDGSLGQLGNNSTSSSLVPTPVVWSQP